jgi:predicted ATP-dependent serine protease
MTLRLRPISELVAEAPEEEEWVIKHLAVPGSGIMLYGRQGIGKSSLICQFAHSIITGEPWMGFSVEKTGPVILLEIDMPKRETIKVIRRANKAGLLMGENFYAPEPEEGEEGIMFDILNDKDMAELADICEQIQPVAVIVDTIHDAYTQNDRVGDINAFIRQVYRRFRTAINGAVLVFLNHRRKQGNFPQKDDEADDDSFMGGQAWEGLVATSIQLARKKSDRTLWLKIHKTRLSSLPFSEIPITVDEFGFFEPKLNYQQMLLQWPECLPLADRRAVMNTVKTKMDVFKDISSRTGVTVATIRQQFYRHPEVEYPWLSLFGFSYGGD